MTSPTELPYLERLMRDVLQRFFEREVGPKWRDELGRKARDALERELVIAQHARPSETPADAWAVAGLREILLALRALQAKHPELLHRLGVWESQQEMEVDLGRLAAFRGKTLHAVGPPPRPGTNQEMDAVILRLRIGFEAVRRRLAQEEGEWWPYIEAIYSNVDEFTYERGRRRPSRALLVQGDLVSFEVHAVHARSTQADLLYGASIQVGSGSFDQPTWTPEPSLSLTAPAGRAVMFAVWIRDRHEPHDGHHDDEVIFIARVRPLE